MADIVVPKTLHVDADHHGQRVDNFLFARLKNIPKGRIYKLLRSGGIRINKGRVKHDYRLNCDDVIRLPYLYHAINRITLSPKLAIVSSIANSILYEDDDILVINKPAGIAVHSGSNVDYGIIDIIKVLRPRTDILLAHRLDKETSGCLILAKNRAILLQLQQQFITHNCKKNYLLLVCGQWTVRDYHVIDHLVKNKLMGGERVVLVDCKGKSAETIFTTLKQGADSTLLKAQIVTGRTHQIRVHANNAGHPIALDKKYGDKEYNSKLLAFGLTRMFLHAFNINIYLPKYGSTMKFFAPLPLALQKFLRCFLAKTLPVPVD